MATRIKDVQTNVEDLVKAREARAPSRQPLAVPIDQPVTFPLELPESEARLRTPAVGQRATRPDGRLHGLGQTQYIDDITFPHMLHAKILRSEYAHARIVSIDTSEAEKMPGVIATLTGAEVPENSFGPTYQDQPILAYPIARHRGDGVAAVAATTEQFALDALEKIKVEYEPLPAVYDPLEALEEDSPKVHGDTNIYTSKVIKKGDVDAGLAASDHVFERRFSTQMVEHVPLEPHATIASWDGNGRVSIWSSLGRITLGREDLARTLQMPQSRVRLIGTVVGGNFGGKNEITNEPIVALLSKKSRRPVKAIYSRGDEFVSSTIRHPFIMDYTTGSTAKVGFWRERFALCLTAARTAPGPGPPLARDLSWRRAPTTSTTSWWRPTRCTPTRPQRAPCGASARPRSALLTSLRWTTSLTRWASILLKFG